MTGPPEQRPSAQLRRSAAVGSTPLRAGHRWSPAPGTVLFPPERPAQVSQHQSPAQSAATLDPESCSWAAHYTSKHKERLAHGRQRSRLLLMHGMDNWVPRRHIYFLSESTTSLFQRRAQASNDNIKRRPDAARHRSGQCAHTLRESREALHTCHTLPSVL